MEDIKVISEWKRKAKKLKSGYKRVQAIVTDSSGNRFTKHLDIKK